MFSGICDIHSHILPGVDDGAKTMEETMETLQEALRQNVRKIIVTPHFHPGRYMADGHKVREVLGRVREECQHRRINVELYPGQECYYYSGLAEQLKKGNALTMAGSSCVLVEFEPDTPFHIFSRDYLPCSRMAISLFWLILNGITV